MFRSFDPDDQISILTGEVTKVRENGATSGIGVLASYGYDDLGNRTSAAYGNGTAQAFGYDAVSRLTSLTVDLAGTASDLTKTFAYNPASQIVSETRSNDAYAQVLANGTQTTVTNGLNQLSTVNGTSAAYDARGNMTTDPVTAKSCTYWGSNNQLWNVPSPYTTFVYDALGRLQHVEIPAVTSYVSDGNAIIAEYDGSNVLQKRYAFDGSGQPLVQYDGAGNRTWMSADERGSIIALANDSGAMTSIDTYDEYGIPAATNAGTFQYAGMMWLSRPGLYAPTYRAYGAHLGRFSQTDPIGMGGGVNLYAYVGGDPVNLVDPLGLMTCQGTPNPDLATDASGGGQGCDIIVTGPKDHSTPTPDPQSQLYPVEVLAQQTIVVTGNRKSKATPPPKNTPFIFNGKRWVANPNYSSQCAVTALKRNAIPIAADLLGLIPGESTAVGATRLSAAVFSGFYSAARGDAVGGILGGAGAGAEAAEMAGDAGRLVPFVGTAISAVSLTREVINTGSEIANC